MCDTPFKTPKMCQTPFKTPLPYRTPRLEDDNDYHAEKMASDSDESVASTNSDNAGSVNTQSSNEDISLVAEFDDLMRYYRPFRSSQRQTETTFLDFVEQVKELYSNFFQLKDECLRLQTVVDTKTQECTDLQHQLLTARKLIDSIKCNSRSIKRERDDLAHQINLVRQLLFNDKTTSNAEEMRRKLSFLSNNNIPSDLELSNGHHQQLSAIKEINSTGSILSDFSYSRSEDDLDTSNMQPGKTWKKHRASTGGVAEPAVKKRRSSTNKAVEIGASDTVRATTTLTVCKDGPITATSIIESVPKTPSRPESVTTNGDTCINAPPAGLVFESWARGSPAVSERRLISREHSYQQKTLVMPENCTACDKRIRFGKTAVKCKECKAICHLECKDKLPLPCIPTVNTPNQKNGLGVIGDYTPTIPPMVPALLIHCINEIELKMDHPSFNEVGLYRVPGSERDVKALKERFLKGKGAPRLEEIDINVICGTVKDFLRSLHEPIVTYALQKKFAKACDAKDPLDIQPALMQVISELPQPNRDTLAYILLHLQKIAEVKKIKMPIDNLAKIFGPTIVGCSADDLSEEQFITEMVKHNRVMEQLLKLPSDYLTAFINVEKNCPPSKLQQTPSTDSLLRPLATRGLFPPLSNRNLSQKKQKYFPSPKNIR